MDIKTRLEDDKVLFLNFLNSTARTNMLAELNKKNILTVEDFINSDTKIFNSATRKIYTAMIHVLRNAYLNEPLVYDALLLREYHKDHIGISLIERDIQILGLVKGGNAISRALYSLGLDYNSINNTKTTNETITMEYILENIDANSAGPCLQLFYINYLKKMKETNKSKNDETISLIELKEELQVLIKMRNDLDQKICVLQEKIERKENGSAGYGKS